MKHETLRKCLSQYGTVMTEREGEIVKRQKKIYYGLYRVRIFHNRVRWAVDPRNDNVKWITLNGSKIDSNRKTALRRLSWLTEHHHCGLRVKFTFGRKGFERADVWVGIDPDGDGWDAEPHVVVTSGVGVFRQLFKDWNPGPMLDWLSDASPEAADLIDRVRAAEEDR